jgi:predicted unusual protein kinase regulating ubiquinone biosynthesis (AarF/ABC1/UbiB family)
VLLLQVTLKATVSTVVVTTLVLEGWSRELNPDLHIMDALRDMLAVDWKERLSRAVDTVRGWVWKGGGENWRSTSTAWQLQMRVLTCV